MGNWTASAWPILASAALKSTLVLGAAWLIAYVLRGRSAAARHMVWTASAAALLALPLLSVALPALRVRVANLLLPAEAGIVFRAGAILAPEAGGGGDGAGGAGQPRRRGDGGGGARHGRKDCVDAAVDGRGRRRITTDAGGLRDAAADAAGGARFAGSGCGGHAGLEFGHCPSGAAAGNAGGDADDVRRAAAHGLAARGSARVEQRTAPCGAAARTGPRAARRCGDALAGADSACAALVESTGVDHVARVFEGTRTGHGRSGAGGGDRGQRLRGAFARDCADDANAPGERGGGCGDG